MTSADTVRDPLATLRHDLRTPINQILGYTELAREEAEDAKAESLFHSLDQVLVAARSLLTLINSELSRESLTAILAGTTRAAAPSGPVNPVSRDTASAMLAASAPTGSDAESDADAGRYTGHILVVDDIAANREVLAARLMRQGHKVSSANDGVAALEMVKAASYDLVLLDILMPGLDGRTVLERMKADPALRHIPVIMISAVDELESVVRCIEIGAEDYLPKPFNPTLLRARIGATLEKKALHDQERMYLKTIEETQARLSSELTEAANYVRSIIPPPETKPLPTDWRLIASTELGGDAFGHHWVDDSHFAVYLLDVCGHGVGAALLAVTAIKVLLAGALPGVDFREPGAVLTSLNDAFLMEKQNDMYFTIWYGVYHTKTRTLRYASAGHPPTILVLPDGQVEALAAKGMVLGGMEGTIYEPNERELPPDSKLFLVSDGTFEVNKADGSMLDYEDVARFLGDVASKGDAELDALVEWVKGIHGPGVLDDDFSILKVRV